MAAQNLSHAKVASTFEEAHEQLLKAHEGDDTKTELINQLAGFYFGQFLIQHRGLNAHWTQYVIDGNEEAEGLERILLYQSPSALATRERAGIFVSLLKEHCSDTSKVADIPSGLMKGALSVPAAHYYAVDIDDEALEVIPEQENLTKIQGDASTVELPEPVDICLSNGLTIYMDDDDDVVAFYQNVHRNLSEGGVFITSFLTPPPGVVETSEWQLDKIDPEGAKISKLVFVDILQASWRKHRTTEQTRALLESAGFTDITFYPGTAGIFPTVLAKK